MKWQREIANRLGIPLDQISVISKKHKWVCRFSFGDRLLESIPPAALEYSDKWNRVVRELNFLADCKPPQKTVSSAELVDSEEWQRLHDTHGWNDRQIEGYLQRVAEYRNVEQRSYAEWHVIMEGLSEDEQDGSSIADMELVQFAARYNELFARAQSTKTLYELESVRCLFDAEIVRFSASQIATFNVYTDDHEEWLLRKVGEVEKTK